MTQQPTSQVQQLGLVRADEIDTVANAIARAKNQIARVAGTEPENIRIIIEI